MVNDLRVYDKTWRENVYVDTFEFPDDNHDVWNLQPSDDGEELPMTETCEKR